MKKSTIIVLVIALLMGLWGVSKYNGMVSSEESVQAQWAKVESSYQRRADLIPNLVSTVKGYADFEKETLTAVTQARASATQTVIDPSNLDAEYSEIPIGSRWVEFCLISIIGNY